jgi:hypothetical protein
MPTNSDWLPTTRTDQLAMAQVWKEQFDNGWSTTLNIPAATVADFTTAVTNANSELTKAQSNDERTEVSNAECRAAFKTLVEKMQKGLGSWVIGYRLWVRGYR